MMEFKVALAPLSPITANLAEIKGYCERISAKYDNAIYGEDEIAFAKADRADLRRLRLEIDEKRKEVKKQWLVPYTTFEAQIKDILSVLDKPILLIDKQIKESEARSLQKRTEELKKHFEKINKMGEVISFERFIAGEKWLLSSYRLARALNEMNEKMEKTQADIGQLEQIIKPEFRTECLHTYSETMSVTQTLAKQTLLISEKEKQEAALGAVENPQEVQLFNDFPQTEKSVFFQCSITATPSQFAQLRAFARSLGIKIREVV